MKKCQICKKEEAVYAWQPDLGETIRESFYILGYHERGFMVVKTCQSCVDKIKRGENVSFRYHGYDYWTNGNKLENSSMLVYG